MNDDGPSAPAVISGSVLGIIALAGIVALGMWGCPTYKVYSAKMDGEAEFAQAQQNKNIAVLAAKAKREAATELAGAEVERAKGVAGANGIIADSLKGNEAYLRYLWITEVAAQNGGKTLIYVPTEAGLPILEAGRSVQK